ncbi:hypothetical protein [Emticicia sp. TH156]|uniref:hypothetical protein n=1 Tax=Emticicia sp. TH156 TaxID=2067454 RepID=UPI000C7702BF|nr:hypothetical protein [Emticicia sp. TH156]PLK46425.1 hypothetical protein C0V77_03525 [Emticicia sp. TH156]
MRNTRLVVYLLLLLLPFFAFLMIFIRYGLNIPFEDDIGLLRSVLIDLPALNDLKDKVRIFFIPQNEHPVAVFKFAIWAYYLLLGNINIKHINFIGNLIFLTSFGFFFRQLKILKISWIWLIPIPYILLSLYAYENALWALCSFQHTAIISFFLWGFYFCFFYTETSGRFYAGLVLLICASFSSGNGILGFISVFIILIFERRFKSAAIISFALLITKFWILNRLPFQEPFPIKDILKSLLILTGSIVQTSSKLFIIYLLGGFVIALLLIFLIYSFFARLDREKRLYYLLTSGICLFALGTFLGLSTFRNIISSDFPDRYRTYTQLLWITLYLYLIPFLVQLKARKYMFSVALLGGMLYFCHSFFASRSKALFFYHQKQLISVNYHYSNTTSCGCYYRNYFDQTLRTLAERNIFLLPEPVYSLSKLKKLPGIFKLNAMNLNSETLYMASENSILTNDGNLFILLLNSANKSALLVPVMSLRNTDKASLLTKRTFFNGFRTAILKNCLPEGTYKVTVAAWKKNTFVFTDSQLIFDTKTHKIVNSKALAL